MVCWTKDRSFIYTHKRYGKGACTYFIYNVTTGTIKETNLNNQIFAVLLIKIDTSHQSSTLSMTQMVKTPSKVTVFTHADITVTHVDKHVRPCRIQSCTSGSFSQQC